MNRLPKILLLAGLLTAIAPVSAHKIETLHRTLSTSGYGEARATPDQIVVSMQAETRQNSAANAKAAVDEQVNRFLQAIAPLAIAPEDIVASNLDISPVYEYQDRQRIFSGYAARRGIRVTLKEIDNLNRLLDLAVTAGVSQILQIAPGSSRAEELQLEAQRNAIADSRRKAALLAKAYGAELGPIFSINYNNSPQPPQPVEHAQLRMSADSGGGQYLHDEVVITDNIQVLFDLVIPQ